MKNSGGYGILSRVAPLVLHVKMHTYIHFTVTFLYYSVSTCGSTVSKVSEEVISWTANKVV